MPPRLKKLGYANVVVGPLVALVNAIVIGTSLSRLAGLGASKGVLIPLGIIAILFCVLGAILFLGGVGLLKERRWGRTWSLVFAFGSFAAAFLANVIARVISNLSEIGEVSIPGLHQQENFSVGIGIFTLYGILVIVMLMLADARAWARGTQVVSVAPTGTINQMSVAPTSGLAIASLVSSLIPFLLLGQITGLILGLIALRKIKQSHGTMGGKGFAIAGVTISSLILLFIIGILVLLISTGAFKK
ncbi:MAG: hypothetical protein DLM73_03715 [Chthoniobacterales bacterium]|nr:MAG: hypothetical protein DLM73_03715 [Chthoniobacterales bacterium]